MADIAEKSNCDEERQVDDETVQSGDKVGAETVKVDDNNNAAAGKVEITHNSTDAAATIKTDNNDAAEELQVDDDNHGAKKEKAAGASVEAKLEPLSEWTREVLESLDVCELEELRKTIDKDDLLRRNYDLEEAVRRLENYGCIVRADRAFQIKLLKAEHLAEMEKMKDAHEKEVAEMKEGYKGELAKLEEKVQELQDELDRGNLLCVVCRAAPKRAIFMGCRHSNTCRACAARIFCSENPRCPTCRTPVEGIMNVYE